MTAVDSIVFDLDKTLIFTSSAPLSKLVKSGVMEDPRFVEAQSRIYYFDLPGKPGRVSLGEWEGDTVSRMWGVIRPDGKKFLRYCFKRFKRVIVWTAGTAEYAAAICNALFRGIHKPYMIWSRGHCVKISELAVEVDKRLHGLGFFQERGVDDTSKEMESMNAKPLDKMVEAIRIIENDANISRESFMIVEDNYHSFITRDFHNAIFVNPFQSSMASDTNNIPGTPGYTPGRLATNIHEVEDDGEEELEVSATEDHKVQLNQSKPTRIPVAGRDLRAFEWLLSKDNTLEKLENMFTEYPDESAEQLTLRWNRLNNE
jgi:hypothetical protein